MKIADLKEQKLILLECISGSRAYGLHTPKSDTDIKGVFALSKKQFYGLEYIEQVNNESNDEVYYELKRFIDLLTKNNPNILELLATPADCILHKNPLMDFVKPELFLSRLCNQTFAGYAQSQIKKAKGLNKKIVNPVDAERKSVLDFCYIVSGQGSVSLVSWLNANNLKQEDCGLVNISHMKEIYSVFHNEQLTEGYLKGISSGMEANDISLSSVPKGIEPKAVMSFNKDGYSKYCKDYKQYWEWVEKRNDARYENTIEHGKNYDAKNMMHTFRLLNMAEEIAKEKKINVRRNDRDYLLKIRSGEFNYDDLVEIANEKVVLINELYEKSDLPERPNMIKAEELLITLRTKIYKEK
ncbi:MAG: nucleotidyltransferase domain-containing protein [Bacteroidetes bacterium]|nr:nucleotidyltransferase domain-containing protein [Bacteroidota bacterium]